MQPVGLRIDVDTLRGTRVGVPNLVGLLEKYDIKATFFFSVGPDNMGRHLWRLLKPAFLFKMLRTRAASLYGWDILTRGTLWPGPIIGRQCRGQIRETSEAGHETGLHAWDHHQWQMTIERMDQTVVYGKIRKGYDLLKSILGRDPDCFASPAWKVTPEALQALDRFPFRFESDCRGRSIFLPALKGRRLNHVQIPTTLPTYDELIGRECSPDTYNGYLLNRIQSSSFNVLTIHAEVEGIICLSMFDDFLKKAKHQGLHLVPLGDLLACNEEINISTIENCEAAGRDGWISCQQDTDPEL